MTKAGNLRSRIGVDPKVARILGAKLMALGNMKVPRLGELTPVLGRVT